MNLRNQGAGLPDGGLFTVDQFARRATNDEIDAALGSMKPSRGAIEVKPPSRSLGDLTKSKQASDYGTAYRHMLLTNLREFALVEYGENGPTWIERFELAEDEAAFWRLCAAPSKAKTLEDRFLDFLRRVLKTPAPLTEPEDVAWFLASYADEKSATMIWHHALAICYAPEWLAENGDAIRADYPRIPMPDSRGALDRSAALGARVASLLDPEVAVDGVTTGKVREDLRKLGGLRRDDGVTLGRDDLAVEARWGALQRGSIVMPGPGKVTPADGPELASAPLGPTFLDIWLNQKVFLHAVPEPVWNFSVGGYQVMKKWLSYREKAVLGRALSLDEARHLTSMVRRISALLIMRDELNAVYREARDTHTCLASDGADTVACPEAP
ncbi:MAG: hypothetical protein IPM54_35145 [Polyangiaceae bacterium]|nr:hypothetical protein [Polyangiaceae bacterium]